MKDIAIVVGSTGAMGQVITQRLHDAGLQVVAVARSANSLHALLSDGGGGFVVADGVVDRLAARPPGATNDGQLDYASELGGGQPRAAAACSNPSGRTNWAQWCVPRGSTRRGPLFSVQ